MCTGCVKDPARAHAPGRNNGTCHLKETNGRAGEQRAKQIEKNSKWPPTERAKCIENKENLDFRGNILKYLAAESSHLQSRRVAVAIEK